MKGGNPTAKGLSARFVPALAFALVLFLGAALAAAADDASPADPPKDEPGPGDAAKPADAGGAEGGEEDGPEDPETRRLLALLDRTHAKIESLEAPYRQIRKVRISRRLRKSKGTLYLRKKEKPAAEGGEKKVVVEVLFVEEEPFESKALFTDEEVVFYDGESGEVRRRDPAQGGVKPSEIWVLGRPLKEIRKHYEIHRAAEEERAEEPPEDLETYPALLVFEPRSEKLKKWVRKVLVWLRGGDALATKVRIVDHTGDWQEFVFDEDRIRVNPELDAGLFDIP